MSCFKLNKFGCVWERDPCIALSNLNKFEIVSCVCVCVCWRGGVVVIPVWRDP